jgi:hypothetical protein
VGAGGLYGSSNSSYIGSCITKLVMRTQNSAYPVIDLFAGPGGLGDTAVYEAPND